jgi:glyoxylate reductase
MVGANTHNSRPKVFITRLMNQEALDVIARETEMEVWPEEYPPSPQVLREKVRDVEGVLTNIMDRVDSALFDSAPCLKVVSHLAVGMDAVDMAEATQRDIPVGYTPGVLSGATADLAFAIMMAAARRVVETERWVRAGNWRLTYHPKYWLGADISGATIGIIGMGNIGLEMAKRAMGFDMRVLYYSRTRKQVEEERYGMEYVDVADLLRTSDFVSLHLPLTPETHHFIGKKELGEMKPTAILVNASRGPVVDPGALYKALKEGRIAAAALDVTEPEPIPPDDPLLTLDNVVVTPHIGSASIGSRKSVCLLAARNLLAGVKGERLAHCANPEVYGSG